MLSGLYSETVEAVNTTLRTIPVNTLLENSLADKLKASLKQFDIMTVNRARRSRQPLRGGGLGLLSESGRYALGHVELPF